MPLEEQPTNAFKSTDTNEVVNPFVPEEPEAQDTEQLRNNMSMYDSVVQLSEEGTEPSETYNNAMLQPASATKMKIVSEAEQRNLSAVDDAVSNILGNLGTEEAPVGDLAEVPTLSEEMRKQSQKPWAAQLAVVDSMDRYVGQDQEFKDKLALNMWFYDEHLAGLYDQIGLNFNTGADIAGLFLLSDESIDISRVVGSFFGSAEGWNRYIQAFQAMPAEEQAASFIWFKEAIHEATDENTIKTMLFLSQLLDPDSATEVNVTQALDKFGLATAIGAVGLKIAQMRKLSTMMKVADRVDNKDMVVKIAHAAAESEEAARALNLDRMDVSATASPFNMENLCSLVGMQLLIMYQTENFI